MNIKTLKKFFEESSYRISLDWNEFQQLAKFNPTDSYEACKDKLKSILRYLPQDDARAWRYFQAVYEDIPVQHRMKLFFECVYGSFGVDYPSVLVMIADYINHQETSEMKAERIKAAREYFKDNVTQDGKITLYRCVMEGYLLPRSAIKFTTSKDDAEYDVDTSEECFGGVCCCEVDVEDIFYYTDDNTVFIVPEDIKNGVYGYSSDLEILTIRTLEKYFPDVYECFDDSEMIHELYCYPIDLCYIVPDLSLNEVPIEATKARKKKSIKKLSDKHKRQREKAYQMKLSDEHSRYYKARWGKAVV